MAFSAVRSIFQEKQAVKFFLQTCQIKAGICQLHQCVVFICQALVAGCDLPVFILGDMACYGKTGFLGNIFQRQRLVDVIAKTFKALAQVIGDMFAVESFKRLAVVLSGQWGRLCAPLRAQFKELLSALGFTHGNELQQAHLPKERV